MHLHTLLPCQVLEIGGDTAPDALECILIVVLVKGEADSENLWQQFFGTVSQVVDKILVQVAADIRRVAVKVVVEVFGLVGGHVEAQHAVHVAFVAALD